MNLSAIFHRSFAIAAALLLAECHPLLAAPGAIYVDAAGNITEPTTIALPSGTTLIVKAGATLDLSAGTITLPSNVVTLTGAQTVSSKVISLANNTVTFTPARPPAPITL